MNLRSGVVSNRRHVPNSPSLRNTMLVDKTSIRPDFDAKKAKQTSFLDIFLSQICGNYETLRPVMLNGLLVLASESDWALSAILEVEYIKPLEEYCEKTQPCEVPMALKTLSARCKSDSATRPFLRTLGVPSGSTDSSSELVPFAGRLCSTLAEHVSEMKSLFDESSASDGSISALPTTLHEKSPLLSGTAIVEVLCEGVSLLNSLLIKADVSIEEILINSNIVPLHKSTIIICLDLLEHEKNESICPSSDRTDLLITILNNSWNCTANSLFRSHKSLHPIIESTFSDVPQLCTLLERTCCLSSPSHSCYLKMMINICTNLPHLIPRLLEEHLIERVIDISEPMTVPIQHGQFHLRFVWVIVNLIWDPRNITQNKEEQIRIRKLLFERVLKPAKQYLQFILQREEFIPKTDSINRDLPTRITLLLTQTFLLEQELFEDGEMVETGREEWEVGWLVEKTKEDELGERLKEIREDDVEMKKDEKVRWKRRVETRREAGHEDAMEGWLPRMDIGTQSEIVEYMTQESVSVRETTTEDDGGEIGEIVREQLQFSSSVCQASQNRADTVVNSHKLPLYLSSFLLSTLPPRPCGRQDQQHCDPLIRRVGDELVVFVFSLAVCVALHEENFLLIRTLESIILEVARRVRRAEREVVEWRLKFNIDGETGEARKAHRHVRVCAACSFLFPTTPFERRAQSFQATATRESGSGIVCV
ncbi:hypothetical protein BLNAU_8025 [Blattamonas nauphoetae]|uniref:Uncharacterized protein n=1 Tax=Blattamonas nauphoetae TaxID=2049346 RepID=A0ABQ9XZQ8_9EUKA|nr:hypothetical protein BLNAU_8025 [Blattamonas nauphoetae]